MRILFNIKKNIMGGEVLILLNIIIGTLMLFLITNILPVYTHFLNFRNIKIEKYEKYKKIEDLLFVKYNALFDYIILILTFKAESNNFSYIYYMAPIIVIKEMNKYLKKSYYDKYYKRYEELIDILIKMHNEIFKTKLDKYIICKNRSLNDLNNLIEHSVSTMK